VPAGGAAGSAAYLVGVFAPTVIEVALARIGTFVPEEGAVPMRELLRPRGAASSMPIPAAPSATACESASRSPR